MAKHPLSKDLFGNPIRQPRPRYEAALERTEKRTLPQRAARVRWLYSAIPKNSMFGMPLETHLVFQDAKSSFIYGSFVATIVLAASFVEHWLAGNLDNLGYHKEANQGLAATIKCARANSLVTPLVLDKAEHLRLIRNPFVHLKPFDHEHTIGQRAWAQKMDHASLLERDAKEALIAMYGVAVYAFSRR